MARRGWGGDRGAWSGDRYDADPYDQQYDDGEGYDPPAPAGYDVGDQYYQGDGGDGYDPGPGPMDDWDDGALDNVPPPPVGGGGGASRARDAAHTLTHHGDDSVDVGGRGGFSSITVRSCHDDVGDWTPRGRQGAGAAPAARAPPRPPAAPEPQWASLGDEARPPHRRSLLRHHAQPPPPRDSARAAGRDAPPPGTDFDRPPPPAARHAGCGAAWGARPPQRGYDPPSRVTLPRQRRDAAAYDDVGEAEDLLAVPLDTALASAPWLRRRFLAAEDEWQLAIREAWPDRPRWLVSLLQQLWAAQAAPPPVVSSARPPHPDDDGSPPPVSPYRGAVDVYTPNGYDHRSGSYGEGSADREQQWDDWHGEVLPDSPPMTVAANGGWDSDKQVTGALASRRRRGPSRRQRYHYDPDGGPAAYNPRTGGAVGRRGGRELHPGGPPQCCNYRGPVCADGCAMM